MKHTFDKILYGGDYNPGQWETDIWKQDMEYFRKAHINSATINVFSWARLQPSEEQYDFSQLDEIVRMLEEQDSCIVMATSTAALPAWLVKRYPEVTRTDFEGRRHVFGQRHNACPNSAVYQKYMTRLASKLAERYHSNPHIVCWHVNNEYGGECYCENCAKAFRVWLRKKYHTLEALNKAWNLEFWGHTVYDWDEIVPPNVLGDAMSRDKTAFAGLSIDYRRFMSDSLLENFKAEKAAIREYDPDTPVTTNLMGTYKGLDYFKWAKELDIVSWDNYPSYNTPWSHVAMSHDLMRGLKDAPFMLMEQTPSQQNWQPYNSLKRPGQMRAQSYQTIAHGADTIQFFQLRRSIGGCEKFHGAVISHAGTDQTRVFREVTQLGKELEALGTRTLGSENVGDVGILFDWDNYWALEYTSGPSVELKYLDQIQQYYEYFYERNYGISMIPADADFSKYKLIAAPVLYMIKDGMKEALEEYVKQGGILITTFMSGIVNQSDNVYTGGYPGPLRSMAGVWVEEFDALAPGQFNEAVFYDGTVSRCGLVCDLMHPEGAEILAEYGSDFYAGMPAVTKNHFGKGAVYYIGTRLDSCGLTRVLDQAVQAAKAAPVLPEQTLLEVTCRENDRNRLYFVINFQEKPQPLPESLGGLQDLLTNERSCSGAEMKKYDVKILAKPR